MSDKIYTAQEMRLTAEYMRSDYAFALIPVSYMPNTYREVLAHEVQEMLRQAADTLELNEKREKMYECKGMVTKKNVPIWCSATYDNVRDARGDAEQYGPKGKVVVLRRSVGEWEEVK